MKKWIVALCAGALALAAAQVALADEPVADAVAKTVCTAPNQTLKLTETQKAYYVGNKEYESMISEFGAETGKVMQFKKAADYRASTCKRVEYGMDANKVWQKTGVYTAPVQLSGDTVSAAQWTKVE